MRSGEMKWTCSVKEVRTAGRVNARKDVNERTGRRREKGNREESKVTELKKKEMESLN